VVAVVIGSAAIAASIGHARRFFIVAGVAAFAIVFAEFAQTFLAQDPDRHAALPWLVHWHGRVLQTR
jgi:hypothetical protein